MADAPPESLVLRILRDRLGIDVADSTVDLVDSGVMDSLMLVELVVAIEQECAIVVDLTTVDLDDLRTVERLERMVGEQRGAA